MFLGRLPCTTRPRYFLPPFFVLWVSTPTNLHEIFCYVYPCEFRPLECRCPREFIPCRTPSRLTSSIRFWWLPQQQIIISSSQLCLLIPIMELNPFYQSDDDYEDERLDISTKNMMTGCKMKIVIHSLGVAKLEPQQRLIFAT